MTSTLRKLLVIGALCWVAPLGAEQREMTEPMGEPACPYERAALADAQARQIVVIQADSPLVEHRGPAAALLP